MSGVDNHNDDEKMFVRWHHDERPVQEQIDDLNAEQRQAYEEVRAKWEQESAKVIEYSDLEMLNFVRNSPGKKRFDAKSAYKTMKTYEKWCFESGVRGLKITDVRAQFEVGSLVVLPLTCKTKEGNHMFYFRGSMFFPGKDPIEALLKALMYLLERFSENEYDCTTGVVFVHDLADAGWSNFSVRDFVILGLDGKYPDFVKKVIVTNPPFFFKAAYSLIKPFMPQYLLDKVGVVSTDDEFLELMSGESLEEQQANAPTQLGGTVDIEQCMGEFVRYRYAVEKLDYEASYPTIEEVSQQINKRSS
eukprot:TRINITY_DN5602_c0_g1_i1.p1 TRINITY_DN5602_c0_g1~~TRINITY_DN5602_c0_g1_i1.p1  ORF type:complete len:304 (-),score=105.50 TRINITY_DN5602_c0_g1_i1:79-990(-)